MKSIKVRRKIFIFYVLSVYLSQTQTFYSQHCVKTFYLLSPLEVADQGENAYNSQYLFSLCSDITFYTIILCTADNLVIEPSVSDPDYQYLIFSIHLLSDLDLK